MCVLSTSCSCLGVCVFACACMCVHVWSFISTLMFRPSVEAASPVSSQPPAPERTSGTFPGSISVVYRDKVMTALWPLFDPGNLFQTQTLNIKTYIDWCPKKKLGWWIHPHPRRHHLFVASLHVFLCAPLWKIPKRTKDLIRKRFSNRLSSPLRGELGEDQGLQGMMQRYCVKLKGQVHSGVIETLRRS